MLYLLSNAVLLLSPKCMIQIVRKIFFQTLVTRDNLFCTWYARDVLARGIMKSDPCQPRDEPVVTPPPFLGSEYRDHA